MNIINIKLSDLKPYERNPRNNKEAVDYVANSIREFGFKNPIIVDKNNVIVAGHTRYLACKKLGIKEVPCVIADDLTDEQIKAFRLADNKVAEIATWDLDLLDEELNDLLNFDMSDFGFDVGLEDPEEAQEDEFDIDELPEEPKAKLGDIYQLGNHRLMCGDSTSIDDVEKLMNGNKADMVFTDPPYNMNYCGAGFINEQNNNVKKRIKDIIDFNTEDISYLSSSEIANNIFIFTSKDLIKQYLNIFDGWNFNMLMWHKTNTPPMINNNYFADTEYCLYFHKGKRVWNNGLKPIDIYKKYFVSGMHEGRKGAGNLHPTMKPIEFISNQVRICSNKNGNVLDIFGGSGSTLIACEQLNRSCYMMELDPKYIDVIIARWEQYTGKKAVLIN
jgi:site-specific DNA-methyltransferase (adenine-specific)